MNYKDLLAGIVEFVDEIKSKNRFHLDSSDVAKDICEYFSKNNSLMLAKGSTVYRARVDYESQHNQNGFPAEEMGAPPSHVNNEGRAHSVGIGCLYCASEVRTAISELRPWASAYVTVAEGIVESDCKIIEFHKNIYNREDVSLDTQYLFELSVNSLFSGRQSSQSKTGYLPSQYLAELLKVNGLDGVSYSSAMNQRGTNIALFDASKVRFLGTEVFSIADVNYKIYNLSRKEEAS
jgi:copper chaperone CopZ